MGKNEISNQKFDLIRISVLRDITKFPKKIIVIKEVQEHRFGSIEPRSYQEIGQINNCPINNQVT